MQRLTVAAQRRRGQENLASSGKSHLNWLQMPLTCAWGSLEILRLNCPEAQDRELCVRAVSYGGVNYVGKTARHVRLLGRRG